MSKTDVLRKLLDERGVEFATDDSAASKMTMWTTQNGGWMFDCDYMEPLNEKPGTIGAKTELMIYGFTPDQAIAATLGSDASAVRLTERFRSIADEMRSVGASSMTPHELLACYANDVDKVADSLMFAATLGNSRADYHGYEQAAIEAWESIKAWNSRAERTCKFVSSKGSDYPPVCSACGYELGIYDCEWFEDGTYGYDGNYCPNCGARVVE